jgi:Glycosyltransferase family 28 C-terminal domain.
LTVNFNKTVLIAPLDWGLGHATRCIPLIKAFKQLGWNVIVATDGACKALLLKEFDSIEFATLKGYDIHYSKKAKRLALKIFFQLPKVLSAITYENKWLKEFLKEREIDLIVSDNRYGFYSAKIPSVFITHQLLIKAPLKYAERVIQKINYRFINRFTQCWIADAKEDGGIAGVLSHPRMLPAIPSHYLGVLSRFEKKEVEKKYDCCIILSGPLEQRLVLEQMVMKDIYEIDKKVLLIRGRPDEENKIQSTEKVVIQNHLTGMALEEAIQQSGIIISRSGYTTVMELLLLQKKAVLIPTPRQTEQEYLGKRLHDLQYCVCMPQQLFNLEKAIKLAGNFNYKVMAAKVFSAEILKGLLQNI